MNSNNWNSRKIVTNHRHNDLRKYLLVGVLPGQSYHNDRTRTGIQIKKMRDEFSHSVGAVRPSIGNFRAALMEQVASQLAIGMQIVAKFKSRKRFVTMVAPKLTAHAAGTVIAGADYGHVASIDGYPAHNADRHRMLRDVLRLYLDQVLRSAFRFVGDDRTVHLFRTSC